MNRKQLQEAFATAASVCSKKAVKECYKWAKCDAKDGVLTVRATDGERGASVTVEGVELSDCEFAVDAQLATDALKLMSSENVDIEMDDARVHLIGAGERNELSRCRHEDWGGWNDMADIKFADAGDQLVPAMADSMHAVDKGASSRYGAMAGVRVVSSGGKLSVMAADGRRLFFADAGKLDGQVDCSVPLEAVSPIVKFISGKCAIYCGSMIAIRSGTVTIWAMLLEGMFPDIYSVLDQFGSPDVTIEVSAGALSNILRSAALMATEENVGAIVMLGDGNLTIESESHKGLSKSTIPVASDDTCQIKVSIQYLHEAVSVHDAHEMVCLKFKGEMLMVESGRYREVIMGLSEQ